MSSTAPVVVPAHAAPDADVATWLAARREASALSCRPMPLAASRAWSLQGGRLVHRTGGFFSVVGVRARSDEPALDGLEQPIILQPEVGILAFLVRRAGEAPELLVQAKAEPGNVGDVHLAPTVQATESNYLRRHGGAPTEYLGHVTGEVASVRVLADALQSEQGTRFLGKVNRNMTVSVAGEGPEPASDAWRWLPAERLLAALLEDYAVNTDARSTLVCSDWQALARDARPFARWRGRGGFGEALLDAWADAGHSDGHAAADAERRLFACAAATRLHVERCGLHELRGWSLDEGGLRDEAGAGFDVRCYDVACAGREVERWDQPLLGTREEGRAVLLVQRREGRLRLALRAGPELGFRECVQLGPTAATGIPSADAGEFAAWCLSAPDAVRHARVAQSDEGGRFHRSSVGYELLEAPEELGLPDDPRVVWVTLREAQALALRPGRLTNEARSLLSMLLAWL